MLFCSFTYVAAVDFNDPSMGTAMLVTETTKSRELSDGVDKNEVISTVCYLYPEGLKSSFCKYLTVRVNLTYLNKVSNSVLAVAVLESNFRCNCVTKQAECLSTSRGNVLNDSGCALNVFSRRANLNTETGGSVAEVKFTSKGKTYENSVYKISCDYMGNVICV